MAACCSVTGHFTKRELDCVLRTDLDTHTFTVTHCNTVWQRDAWSLSRCTVLLCVAVSRDTVLQCVAMFGNTVLQCTVVSDDSSPVSSLRFCERRCYTRERLLRERAQCVGETVWCVRECACVREGVVHEVSKANVSHLRCKNRVVIAGRGGYQNMCICICV